MDATQGQEPNFIQTVAAELGLREAGVRAAIRLLEEGNTIPFIARYRKEMTGELDENQLRDIAQRHEFQRSLHARKQDVLRLLTEQGVLADPGLATRLGDAVAAATTLTELDDIYRPYRPKRKTRASVAKERGLEPLLAWLSQPAQGRATEADVLRFAIPFGEQSGITPIDAVQGALDIFAEQVADAAETRQWVRSRTFQRGHLHSRAVDAAADSVYTAYYDLQERMASALPHRILAMNRGEREGFLRIVVVAPVEDIAHHLSTQHRPRHAVGYVADLFADALQDAYKRLIAPSIEREVRAQLTETAETHAIAVFGENLHNLLMQPPIAGRRVLGVDPAYRTGCKLAVVDETGKLCAVAVIYPTPPQSKVAESEREVTRLLTVHDIDLVVIGNGTASRETEAFIADCLRTHKAAAGKEIPYMVVSEAGASVYSASVLAGEEFPDLDVSERSAVSIARRVQDPLAELVKIDPKSVGVGQYQHDVSQQHLGEKLGSVVESVVNQVGVDLNTASPSLLAYVSGLNKTVAKNIVAYRDEHGRFRSRRTLAEVPRLGKKTLEQCVGFLRIVDGDEWLDRTPIHPESYPAVERLLAVTSANRAVLVQPEAREAWLRDVERRDLSALAAAIEVGEPTLRDIVVAFGRPGRDPREDVPPPLLRTDVVRLEDLQIGTVLTGTVRNVVDFGAFVDVGLKNDGLVHVSQLSNRFVKHPMDVVSIGDVVTVRVIQVDVQKQRLGLSMKDV